VAKPQPIDVFEDNIAGAEQLIGLTKGLLNTRKRAMRRERREALGVALRLPKRDWDDLDWVESSDVFVILKPDGTMTRENFAEQQLRPLLRQAVVAIAAAVESYVAEKACCYIGSALKDPPERLRGMSVSLGDIFEIDTKYKRRGWGYRDILEDHLIREASAAPSKIGIVFSFVGQKDIFKRVDARRHVPKGTSERQLDDLATRRNRIAHTGDHIGRKRATLAVEEVETHHANAKSIVESLEAVLP
jgi:hypothetical protein